MLTLGCRARPQRRPGRASTLTPEGLRCCPHSGGETRLRGSGRCWGHGTPRAVLRPPPLRAPQWALRAQDTRLRALSTYWSAGHRPSASGRAGPQHWAAWQLEDTGRGRWSGSSQRPDLLGSIPFPTLVAQPPQGPGRGHPQHSYSHIKAPDTAPSLSQKPPAHPPCPSLCCCVTPATGGVCVWLHLTPRQHRARLKGDG